MFFGCAFLAVAVATAGLASCRRTQQLHIPGPRADLDALAFLPSETEIVVALDLDRLRSQPIWKAISPALAKHAGPSLDEIAAGTGLEATRQVHRVWIGLPGERQEDGRFVLLAETDPLDAARATAWLEKRAEGKLAIALPNPRQFLIAKGAWAGAAATRPARSAADNVELRRLCQRLPTESSLWIAALVPIAVRRALMESSKMSDVATLVRVSASLRDSAGLRAELVGEFGNTADPPLLAHRLKVLQNQAKRYPDMLVAGLSPYLEAVHVEANDASVRVVLDLPDAQAGDVIERTFALARTPRTKYSPAP
jgi:hypothetical protein